MIVNIISKFKYPPYRYNPKKLPDKLIYQWNSGFGLYDFVMFKTDKSQSIAKMSCHKSFEFINNKVFPSLSVMSLRSEPQNQGLGTEMLKFAARISKTMGCEGRFSLSADPQLQPKKVPHIFYRKFGMNTQYPEINNKLDEFIKSGKNATIKDFKHVKMYYPPLNI